MPEEPNVQIQTADAESIPHEEKSSSYLSREAQKSTAFGLSAYRGGRLPKSTFAYIAGFFDGEGSVRIKSLKSGGRLYHSLMIKFTNTDLSVLTHIRSIIGGSIRPLKSKNPKWKPAWDLRTTNRAELELILVQMLPFLIVKRHQIELALAFLALGKMRWREKSTEIARRVALKNQLHLLNQRGAEAHFQ